MSYQRKKRESIIVAKEDARLSVLYADEIREYQRRTTSCTRAGCIRVTIVMGAAFFCGASLLFFLFILIARE